MAWVNYGTICRLCLQQDGYLLAIFSSNVNDTVDNSIQKKIVEFTDLEVSLEDGLPSCICHRCLYKVELCFDFKQQCLMSDATLRQVNGQRQNGTNNVENLSSYHSRTVSVHEFEKFTNENQKFIPDVGQEVENVVMVVNPDMEYDSDNESVNSDVENADGTDIADSEQLRNVFMCKFCDRAYTEREQCRVHEISEHNIETPFMCAQCDTRFGDRTNYINHLKLIHQNDKPFGCPQCPRSFTRRSDLRKHTVVHTGIKPFTCQVCYKSFSRNTNLTKHMRIHSGHKPYVCPQCPKTFISKGDLTRHALIHSGHKPFPCGYCEQSFGRRDKLLRHEKRHFPNGNEDRSEAVTAELEMLRQQMSLSVYGSIKQETDDERDKELIKEDSSSTATTASTPITNNLQGSATTSSSSPQVQENQSKINEPIDSSLMMNNNNGNNTSSTMGNDVDDDDEIGENMVINVDPFNHEDLMHRVPVPVPDHIAMAAEQDRQQEYDMDDSMAQLKSTVNAIKKYPCFQCNKRFSSAESLRFHAATHSGNRPHVCHQCNKSFLRKRELDRHIVTHTGKKPFKCTHCDKCFGRKDKLKRHMHIHAQPPTLAIPTNANIITPPTATQSVHTIL